MQPNEDFKSNVLSYCHVDEELAELAKRTKELKARQKELGEGILDYMTSNSLEVCNVGQMGMLMVQTKKSCSTLNKDYIHDCLVDVCKTSNASSPSFATEATNYIMDHREEVEKKHLKRKKTRNRKT